MKFNERLREARRKANITQISLAKMCNVSQGTIANWESGYRTPDLQMFAKLSKILNVSLDYLIENDSSESDETKKATQVDLQGFTQDEFNKVMSESEWYQYLAELRPENRSRLKDYAELLLLSQGQADQEEK